jgi:hypothetical protein
MSERPTLSAPPSAIAALASRQAEVPKPTIPVAQRPGGPLRLKARALKVTLVLDPAAIAGFTVPNGVARVEFVVAVDGRKVTGSFSAKSVRKAVAAIAEHGPEAIALVLQGKLATGDVIEECGIAAQVKGPKPTG